MGLIGSGSPLESNFAYRCNGCGKVHYRSSKIIHLDIREIPEDLDRGQVYAVGLFVCRRDEGFPEGKNRADLSNPCVRKVFEKARARGPAEDL